MALQSALLAAVREPLLWSGLVVAAVAGVYIWRVKAPPRQKLSALGAFLVIAGYVYWRLAGGELNWTVAGIAMIPGSFFAMLTARYGTPPGRFGQQRMEADQLNDQTDRLTRPTDFLAGQQSAPPTRSSRRFPSRDLWDD